MAMCNTETTNKKKVRVWEAEGSNNNNCDDNRDSSGGEMLCVIRMKIADVSFYWFHGQD